MIGAIKNWLIKKYTHILIWGIFIAWEVIVIGLSSGLFGNPLTYIVHYSLAISLFYFHAVVALPWANKGDSYVLARWLFIIMAQIVAFEISSYIFDSLLIKLAIFPASAAMLNIPYVMKELYRGLYFLGFATGYYYIMTYISERKRSADLETQRLQEIISRKIAEEEAIRSQNAFLVAQINPHFLFNTLDYLYHNLLPLDLKLADAVISLSGMMRFAIDADKMGNTISLSDELEQVENLIYLHQVRQKLWVELITEPAVEEFTIIPLVLLTLTENVFKHGNLKSQQDASKIKIFTDDSYLHIETENTINKIAASARSLTGLSNIRKRLEVAYPGKFTFMHGPEPHNKFRVHLMIELDALNSNGIFSYHSADIDKV